MSMPFDSFQQGMMTGQQLGSGLRQRRNARELGGLMASGDVAGARAMAYGQGDLQTGQALDGQVRDQAQAERGQQLTGALRSGDFDAASGFAQTPQELAAIETFRNNASETERAQAAQRFGTVAMAIESVQGLPPEQQGAAAQEAARSLGLDPSQLPPDTWTPQGLERARMQALGYAEYLEFKQDQRDAQSPRYVPALGGFLMPPGAPGAPGTGQPQTLDALPQGARIRPRPNQPSPALAAGGGERGQPVGVSFRTSQEAQAAITSLVPGVRVTSGARSPADNRRVGGAPGSFHLQDRARDLVPPPGMSMAQLEAKMRQAGFRALNEGDHIHVSW
jgi:hypothetical protein